MNDNLIIGYGEIGKSIDEVIGPCLVYDIVKTGKIVPEEPIKFMHVAIPYSEDFVSFVSNFQDIYKPDVTIVYSTVPIGTCEKIGMDVVHSPVEGRHPNLADSIRYSPRWLGCHDKIALGKAMALWDKIVLDVKYLKSSRYTELLKLRSTAKYAINLVWTDYEKKLTDSQGMPFQHLKDFDKDYNDLYSFMVEFDIKRYILDPPNG